MRSSVLSAHEALLSHIRRRYQGQVVQTRSNLNLNCRTSRIRCFQKMCARPSSTASSKILTKQVRDCTGWLAENARRKYNSALKRRKHRSKVKPTTTIQMRKRPFLCARGFKNTFKECRE